MMEGQRETGRDENTVSSGARAPMEFTANWEPPMRDQDSVAAGYVTDEQRLMVVVKLLSITLLGGHHYRVALKVGIWDRPDVIATVLVDPRTRAAWPEGSIAADFDGYRRIQDPLELPADQQTEWFTCCAIDKWIERALETASLEPTLVWSSR